MQQKEYKKFEILNRVSSNERNKIRSIFNKLMKINSFKTSVVFNIDHYLVYDNHHVYGLEDPTISSTIKIPSEIQSRLEQLYKEFHDWCVRNFPKIKDDIIYDISILKRTIWRSLLE